MPDEPRRRFTNFYIYLLPTHWQLWPPYQGGRWVDRKRISLGPLVIQWDMVPVYDDTNG